jgi:site-specific DNA-adenine methylase
MKGGKANEPLVDRVNLSKTQWTAIKVLLNAKSSGRETTTALATLNRQPLNFEVIAQDTQPGTLGSPLPLRAFVLPMTRRQTKALMKIVNVDNMRGKTPQQAKLRRAREVLTRMGLVAYPSADYPRLSPPKIERYRRDPPRPRKTAGRKPGDKPPEDGDGTRHVFLDAAGQSIPFERWRDEVLAGQSSVDFHYLLRYFGGKSKIAALYPEPYYRHIIEPFAGGAAYSLLYADHDIWLNDTNPQTVAIWRFLLRKDALKVIRDRVPFSVKAGTTIEKLTKATDPEGLVELMRAQLTPQNFGRKGVIHTATSWGAEGWDNLRERLEYWVPRIAHWKVTMLDYADLPNKKACWFIDPPYKNEAGASYAKGSDAIKFKKLGAWCKSRHGQAIVCENAGATWLPFKTLTDKRRGIYNDDTKSTVGEMIWTRADSKRGLWAD